MADTKVTDLTTASSVAPTDHLYGVVGGNSRKVPVSLLATATEVAKSAVAVAKSVPWVQVLDDLAGGSIAPAMQYEPDLGLLWLNGRVTTLAAVSTNNGDGTYTLTELPTGLSAGVTMFAQRAAAFTGTPTGKYMGMTANPTSLAGEVAIGTYYHATSGTLGAYFHNRMSSPVSEDQVTGWGAERMALSVSTSGASYRVIEGSPVVADSVAATYVTPTTFVIGGWARNSRDPLTNASIKRLIVYPRGLTSAQLDHLMDVTHPDYGQSQDRWPKWLAALKLGAGNYLLPALQFDYSRGRCWFNGRERAFADVFVDPAGGNFTLKKPPRGLTTTSGITYALDTRRDDYHNTTDVPSGLAFQAILAFGAASLAERIQWGPTVNASGVLPGGIATTAAYSAKAAATFDTGSTIPSASTGVVFRGQGIHRDIVSVPASGNILTCHNAGAVKTQTASVSSYVPQDLFRFGAAWNGTSPLANCDLVQGILYNRALTKAEVDQLAAFNEYGISPLLHIGDSFNNVQQPAEMLALHMTNRGYSYIPWWSDGRGSMGLNYLDDLIAAYITFDAKFTDYLLVMNEGGFDYTSPNLAGTTQGPFSERDIQNYLATIFGRFREPRKVYMEGHSNFAATLEISGGTDLTKLRTTMANIKASYPEFFCESNALMQAQATTDADYLAFRADGRTPAQLRSDTVHISWGTAYSGADSGYYWWSLAMMNKLAQLGWVPQLP